VSIAAHAPLEARPQIRAVGGGRRCACGGLVGPTGECAACSARRIARPERSGSVEAAAPSSARPHRFGAINAERKNGVAHGPAGSPNKFDDCPVQWKTVANAAAKLGSSWVANVIGGLTHLPTPIPAPVSTLLTKHFHTTYDKDIASIVARYRKISTAIDSSIDFQCETECDRGVRAYVYSVWSDLHLCPDWFNSGPAPRARSVIHELAHDVTGCDDNAYAWETAKYAGMSVNDAMDNADSYAHFARDAAGP